MGSELQSPSALDAILRDLADLDLSDRVDKQGRFVIGAGGYCDVFCGQMLGTGTKVAIRRMRIILQKERKFAKQMVREIRIWNRIDHPNILPMMGYIIESKDGAFPALVTPWMKDGTLREYLAANPEAQVIDLTDGVANGMEYLHSKEIVHADLKADNVLVSPTGKALVADFGISVLLSASQTLSTTTGGVKGSIRWMAKELFDGSNSSKESDVWAFGMTVYPEA